MSLQRYTILSSACSRVRSALCPKSDPAGSDKPSSKFPATAAEAISWSPVKAQTVGTVRCRKSGERQARCLSSRVEREAAQGSDISQSIFSPLKNSKTNKEAACMHVEDNRNISSSRYRRDKEKSYEIKLISFHNGELLDVIYLGFITAFDTISNNFLINKLGEHD